MINTMLVNRFLSTWTRRSFASFFQLIERNLHRVIPTTLIYTGPHLVQVITTNDYLSQTEYFTLHQNITALRKCKQRYDLSYKTSPSSSSEKPIYPHRINHLLAFVPICDFMLLDNMVYPDFLKIEGDGKQMMMMDNFWSQSRWRFRWKHFQRHSQVGGRGASLRKFNLLKEVKHGPT
jgi:hypothetical protein